MQLMLPNEKEFTESNLIKQFFFFFFFLIEKIRAPDGTWTHDPPWSSRML